MVAPDGSQIGIKKLEEALWLAEQLGLDLVEVAPAAKPPVCRLMDYGKYKYEQSIRNREARKKQTRTVIKEVRFSPRIGEHDYLLMRRRTEHFLADGDKVKITMRFRGRERERPELGRRVLDRLTGEVAELGVVEQPPAMEGRHMTMVLAPLKKAGVRRAEAPREVAEAAALGEAESGEEPDEQSA